MTRWWLTMALYAVIGCDADTADGAIGVDVGPTPCDTAPVTTWDNFGAAFLATQCNGCHARSAPNRHGAPIAYSFDSEADVRKWRDAILDVATGDAPTMPPAGGVRDADRARLQVWLNCDL